MQRVGTPTCVTRGFGLSLGAYYETIEWNMNYGDEPGTAVS